MSGVAGFKVIGVHGRPTLIGTFLSLYEFLCCCVVDAEEDVEENNRSLELLSGGIPLEANGERAIEALDVIF